MRAGTNIDDLTGRAANGRHLVERRRTRSVCKKVVNEIAVTREGGTFEHISFSRRYDRDRVASRELFDPKAAVSVVGRLKIDNEFAIG